MNVLLLSSVYFAPGADQFSSGRRGANFPKRGALVC